MIKEVTRSLSARLVAVFFVTSLVYGFGAVYAVRMVRETDYLREIVGSHISLHADLVLKEIGTPPDPAKAKAIVDRIPVDIRISSPGVQWSSSPDFPDLKTIPFGPIAYLDLDHKSERDIESWAQGLERVAACGGVCLAASGRESATGSDRTGHGPVFIAGAVTLFSGGALAGASDQMDPGRHLAYRSGRSGLPYRNQSP
jgi:hypothetical protein